MKCASAGCLHFLFSPATSQVRLPWHPSAGWRAWPAAFPACSALWRNMTSCSSYSWTTCHRTTPVRCVFVCISRCACLTVCVCLETYMGDYVSLWECVSQSIFVNVKVFTKGLFHNSFHCKCFCTVKCICHRDYRRVDPRAKETWQDCSIWQTEHRLYWIRWQGYSCNTSIQLQQPTRTKPKIGT